MKKSTAMIGFLLFTIFYRLIPHPFNFTPLISYCIFSGILSKNKSSAIAYVWLPAIITDLLLGLYPSLLFNYLAYALICLLGQYFQHPRQLLTTLSISTIGASLFFLISNFGLWLMGDMYTHDAMGLASCYHAAIPFYQHTLLGSLLFSSVFAVALNYPTYFKAKAC